ncbi:MAG: hypothetical protein FJZ08_01390 [Candidatus Omnitrophica bacterium]|nr:hypothetical protein [Candidatus Omnitrophota bacterium]
MKIKNNLPALRIGLSVLASAILYLWVNFLFSSEEGRIRSFILEGKRSAESKNILSCASMISRDYSDKYNNDRQTLIYIAREAFAYYKAIIIGIDKMDIRIDDSKVKATVEIVAMALCQSKDNKSEKIFEGEKGRFRVKLIKEKGKWQLLELELLERMTIMGQVIDAA